MVSNNDDIQILINYSCFVCGSLQCVSKVKQANICHRHMYVLAKRELDMIYREGSRRRRFIYKLLS